MSGRALISPETIHRALGNPTSPRERAAPPPRASAMAAAVLARIDRVVVDGETFTPVVFGDGRYADLELLRCWADQPGPGREGRPTRHVRFVVIDESPCVLGSRWPGWRIDTGNIRLGQAPAWKHYGALPIIFGDTSLRVGSCDRVWLAAPGTIPGTVGRPLVAEARILDTYLATLVWNAIRAGVLDGFCVMLDAIDATRARALDDDSKVILASEACHVVVGTIASSCCGNARLLKLWEGE
jgi:hypothetical protein